MYVYLFVWKHNHAEILYLNIQEKKIA